MCEIHIIKPIGNKITDFDRKQIFKLLSIGSKTNSDGFGLFSDNDIYKNEKEYNSKFEKKMLKVFNNGNDSFIIAHNRFKTIGEIKEENTHPFFNNRFVWVHNGHISNYETLKEENNLDYVGSVDSLIIGNLLYKKTKNRKYITEYLKETLNSLSGSFSCFIFDKKTKRLYYVLHNAYFSFRLIDNKGKKIIIGSTSFDNLLHIYNNSIKKIFGFSEPYYKIINELMPKENMVYEITEKGLIELFKVKPKEEIVSTSNYSSIWNNFNSDYGYIKDYSEIRDKEKNSEIIELDKEEIDLIQKELTSLIGSDFYVNALKKKKGYYKIWIKDYQIRNSVKEILGLPITEIDFDYKELLEFVKRLRKELETEYTIKKEEEELKQFDVKKNYGY